mmetsp:Transcript_21117/g.35422  ORF Transcript_21117/g.35422 Transcript_21117/m.35422 type:complete len:264 (+) Transcript_21117:105-896(+)
MTTAAKNVLGMFTRNHRLQVESIRNLALLNLTLPPNTVAPGIPMVLNITLKEDCIIQADEDYIPNLGVTRDQRVQEAGRIWDEHGSGAIMRPTIPADWITSVEYLELDVRTAMFPICSYLLDDWEQVQQALDNRTVTVEDLTKEAMSKRRELVEIVYETRSPASKRFDLDVTKIGWAVKYCQEKPPSSRDQWRDTDVETEVYTNGNRAHLAFSGRCNATFGEVSDLLNSNAVFTSDRDRLDYCKLLLTQFTKRGREFGLRMMS